MAIVIVLRDVMASLGGQTVLQAVSLSVAKGERVAVCGPNGAGKSSVIRAACGLLPLAAGSVLLDGTSVTDLSERERAARIAYLPQDRRIAWNMPAVDVVTLALPFMEPEEARGRALLAMAEVEIEALAGRGVADMSGGERARVLVARVLAAQSIGLALDEPIAGLDPDAQILLMQRLKDHATAGRAVIFSIHDLSLAAQFSDRVVVLHRGAVVADGPPLQALSADILQQAFSLSGEWLDGPAGPILAATRVGAQGL